MGLNGFPFASDSNLWIFKPLAIPVLSSGWETNSAILSLLTGF